MTTAKSLVWFRQDLRLTDHPALLEASKNGTILPVFIVDTKHAHKDTIGAASRAWLHYSLQSLQSQLANKLNLYIGDPIKIIEQLVIAHDIQQVYWNRCYEPWQMQRDSQLKTKLRDSGKYVKALMAGYYGNLGQFIKKIKHIIRCLRHFIVKAV